MNLSTPKARKILYNNTIAKKIFGFLKGRSFSKFYNFNHLSLVESQALNGSICRDEALFIFSLIKMIRPKVVVEFGFARGHSALNVLTAIDKDAKLYSFDIAEFSRKTAEAVFNQHKNFHFRFKSQLDFTPEDVHNQKIDLVYFDAVYDRNINMATFEKLKSSLSDESIIMLHDTNVWKKTLMDDAHISYASKKPNDWLNENEFQSQKGQREFFNDFLEKFPEYAAVTLHSSNIPLLSGISLLQKKKVLKTQYE